MTGKNKKFKLNGHKIKISKYRAVNAAGLTISKEKKPKKRLFKGVSDKSELFSKKMKKSVFCAESLKKAENILYLTLFSVQIGALSP